MAILNWVVNRYEQENINNKNQNNKSEMAKFKSAYERAKEIDKAREMQEGRKSE
jgi:hypothetical protein